MEGAILNFQHTFPPLVAAALCIDCFLWWCRLLALGLQELNNNWAAIQERFLPAKSAHQVTAVKPALLTCAQDPDGA